MKDAAPSQLFYAFTTEGMEQFKNLKRTEIIP